ncbi:tail fiber protein [Vibrio phage Seahorse]|uniref:Tail tubular protein n=1 Tax=Vibrio phage Seahorse TaxID=2662136 RepID=A0A6B7SIZ1_9CAUD|nr:tail fiber protein [Vibrio phage Seahorse]QGF21011.1 tail tubular protein [Vibrio phage Seahorse]
MADCSKIPTLELVEDSKKGMSDIVSFANSSDNTYQSEFDNSTRTTIKGALNKLGGNNKGNYLDDPLLQDDVDYAYFSATQTKYKIAKGVLAPYQVNSTTYPDPETDPNLTVFDYATNSKLEGEITTAQNDIVGGKLFKGSNGDTVEVGDTVLSGTTHLRVLVGGEPAIVAMSPISVGLVSSISETGAVIGTESVSFFSPIDKNYKSVEAVISGVNGYPLIGDTITTSSRNGIKVTSRWEIRNSGDYIDGEEFESLNNGNIMVLVSEYTAKAFGCGGGVDDTDNLQRLFDSTRRGVAEIDIDCPVVLDTTKNTVQNTDPRPPLDDGETSSAAIVINHPVVCKSDFEISAKVGPTPVTTYHYLFSTNTDDGIHLELNLNGKRDEGAPSSSLGVQVNNDNVTTKNKGGNFGSSPLVLNGNARNDPLLNQKHDNHAYSNVGNSIFCRYVKNATAKNWTVRDVSEGFDLDKTCDGVNLDDWTVFGTRGDGADAAIEMNGAKNCTARNLFSVGFKTGAILNAKERYDEPGVYDRCENCSIDGGITISPTDGGVIVGNVTGDFTDTIDCSADDFQVFNATTGRPSYSVSGTNFSMKNAKSFGSEREGALIRGGTVNADGFESYESDRAGVDVLDGAKASLRNAHIENPNKSLGGHNGINAGNNTDVNVVGATVKGAAEYSIRKTGTGEFIFGNNDLSGALQDGLRYSSSANIVQMGDGKGSVQGGVQLGHGRRVFYASKSYTATSSLLMKEGDVIIHNDAFDAGDYYGRICYQVVGSIPQFRNFGKIE